MNPIKKGLDTMLGQLKKDLPYLENKYHRTDRPFDAFSRMAYHGWECPEDSGLDDAGKRLFVNLRARFSTKKKRDRKRDPAKVLFQPILCFSIYASMRRFLTDVSALNASSGRAASSRFNPS